MNATLTIPSVTLANGVEMPAIGYGVFRMEDGDVCERAVLNALDAGYRFIDTATAYRNEKAVGRALARSGIPREELFVSTKLQTKSTCYELAREAFERSLDDLGLEYVDLYFIHQPYNDVFGAWRALAELMAEGRIRALGVDNFTESRLVDFLTFNNPKPVANFVEVNPGCQQVSSVPFMLARSVQPLAWSPLGAGNADILGNPVLAEIGAAHGKSVAQIALRWLVQRSVVPVVKSANPVRMREDLDIFDFELSTDEMAAFAPFDTGVSAAARTSGPELEAFLAKALA